MFHELPPEVRRIVLSEFARVLKPGGRLVLVDSLQLGDEPISLCKESMACEKCIMAFCADASVSQSNLNTVPRSDVPPA